MVEVLIVFSYLLSFLMSFAVGANDAADSLGCLYGVKAFKLVYILLIGACFEFIGAVWCSGHIASTLVPNLIPGIEDEAPEKVTREMLGASISSFIFIMGSSVFGMPISGTHSVVGALIGAGMVGSGADSINYRMLIKVVASWFVSPLLSMSLCFVVLVISVTLTFNGVKMALSMKIFMLSLIYATVFALINFMFLQLV